MQPRFRRHLRFSRPAIVIVAALAVGARGAIAAAAVATVPGMPPVLHPDNLYSEAQAGRMSAAVAGALPRIYVPNLRSNDVYVIDPATHRSSTGSPLAAVRSTSCRHGTCRRCGSRTMRKGEPTAA